MKKIYEGLEKDEVSRLISKVNGLRELGKRLGVSHETARAVCRGFGLPTPKQYAMPLKRTLKEVAHKLFIERKVEREKHPAEYTAYTQAKARCTRVTHPNYARYGWRGIKFKFRNFHHFLEVLGPRPKGRHPSGRSLYSVHRRNNNGHYEAGNVKWATQKEQCSPGARRT